MQPARVGLLRRSSAPPSVHGAKIGGALDMTKHTLTFTLAVWAGLMLFAPAAMPQATSTATVSGQVTDQQGGAVAGAVLQMREPTANTTVSTTTNEVGRYVIVNVPSGTYTMTFSEPGFAAYRVNDTVVTVGTAVTVNGVLEVGATTTTECLIRGD